MYLSFYVWSEYCTVCYSSPSLTLSTPLSPLSPLPLPHSLSPSPHPSLLLYSLSHSTGGGGGKGTWGKLSDEMEDDCHTKDYRDPNYDSADEVCQYL